MNPFRRWSIVAAAIAVLVSAPALVARLPAGSSSLGATQVLAKVLGSQPRTYSGYAESTGSLNIPVIPQFGAISELFGGTTSLRVWWRGADDWRVDSVNITGETDVHTSAGGTWRWDYQRNSAQWTPKAQTAVRLPQPGDLLPPLLGRRLLSEAKPGEVSRLGTVRIAGRSAVGLLVRPSQAQSSIDSVQVWADPTSGIPMQVRVFAKGVTGAVLSTHFLDFSTGTPSARTTAFVAAPGATLQYGEALDLLGAAQRFGRLTPPPVLAGLSRNSDLPARGSVGVYGRGVTELVAVLLPRSQADGIRKQLDGRAGVETDELGSSTAVGGIALLLTSGQAFDRFHWLLVGTVTAATLRAAAQQLERPR